MRLSKFAMQFQQTKQHLATALKLVAQANQEMKALEGAHLPGSLDLQARLHLSSAEQRLRQMQNALAPPGDWQATA